MIHANNITVSFGNRILFKDANVKFTPGNCYGLIGANGAGKSTFLKVLAKEIEPNEGEVLTNPNDRIAVLRQDQFAFDEFTVMDTVIMGHKASCTMFSLNETRYMQRKISAMKTACAPRNWRNSLPNLTAMKQRQK